ncbi:alpha/beta hydrolase [Actinomadura sp. 7K534]|nr:alpha/beta hydrolase [Actinomadura sp. 7K534]
MARHRAISGTVPIGAAALAVSGLISSLSGMPAQGAEATTAAFKSAGAESVGAESVIPPAAVSPPVWKRCTGLPKPAPGLAKPPAGFRCATLKVPLDYAAPSGRKIDIALIRTAAAEPDRRIGSLLFNFGGPGGDGVDTLARFAGQYAELGKRYDLVAFDPRGVGRSTPVTCAGDRRMDEIVARDDSPDTAAEEKAYLGDRTAYAAGCAARAGYLLPHVGTRNAAGDMEVIRTALGEEKLNYFGISYGTWLGGSYARQFPARVGRAVLDAAVDTKIGSVDLALQQAASFQRALGDFGAACARLGRKHCPMGADGPSVVASIGRILDGLDRRPLPTSTGRLLTQSLATTGVGAGLYSRAAWPYLAQGLVDAVKRRDGSLLLMLADTHNGRRDNGTYTNLAAANTAVTCADGADRHTPAGVRRLLPRFRAASPVFGATMAWSLLECTGWPVAGDDAAREVSAPSAAPILVIGNTGDPATPYAWAPALTKELGGRATLLTLRGDGHGAYDTGDPCVRETVHAYLLQGTVPAGGATCG